MFLEIQVNIYVIYQESFLKNVQTVFDPARQHFNGRNLYRYVILQIRALYEVLRL